MKGLYFKYRDIERVERLLKSLREKSVDVGALQIKEKIKNYNLQNIVEDRACRIMLLENELKLMKKGFQEKKAEIIKSISELDNLVYRELLTLRYIEFKKWGEIAKTLSYSTRSIYYLHKKALKELANLKK